MLLIGLVALAAFPTFSIGKSSSPQVELRANLLSISRDFVTEVGFIQTGLSEQLRLVPRVIPEGSVALQIESIGDLGYGALTGYNDAYKSALTDARTEIATAGVGPDDAQVLRGFGACVDRAIEEWIWNSPTAFAKWLAMTLRRPRLSVEYFDVNANDFVLVPLFLSTQVFPNPKDRLIFTTPSLAFGNRVRIDGIVGGSYTRFNENDAITTACVFGGAAAGASMTVTAEGLGGPFVGNDTADLNGRWDVCLPGLKQGYYKFLATDGTRSDEAEQGFLRRLQFTF